jgi:hypothetical protein
MQTHQGATTFIGDLIGVIQTHRVPVIHPLQWHPGDIGPEYLLI